MDADHSLKKVNTSLIVGISLSLLFILIESDPINKVIAKENNIIEVKIIQEGLVNCYSWSDLTMEIKNNGDKLISCNIYLSARSLILSKNTFFDVEIGPYSNKSIKFKVKADEGVLSSNYDEKENLDINILYMVDNIPSKHEKINVYIKNETLNIAKVSIELMSNQSSLYLNTTNYESSESLKFSIDLFTDNAKFNIGPELLSPKHSNITLLPVNNFTYRNNIINVTLLGEYKMKGNFSFFRTYNFKLKNYSLKCSHIIPYIIFIEDDFLTNLHLNLGNTFYLGFTVGKTYVLLLLQDLFIPNYHFITIKSEGLIQREEEIIYLKSEDFIGPILGGVGLLPLGIIVIFVVFKRRTLERKPSIFPPNHIDVG